MTWTPLLERLSGLLEDIPTLVALGGLASSLAVSAGLVWLASQRYVKTGTNSWRLTTWEKAMEAELGADRQALAHETEAEAADQLDCQEVT